RFPSHLAVPPDTEKFHCRTSQDLALHRLRQVRLHNDPTRVGIAYGERIVRSQQHRPFGPSRYQELERRRVEDHAIEVEPLECRSRVAQGLVDHPVTTEAAGEIWNRTA